MEALTSSNINNVKGLNFVICVVLTNTNGNAEINCSHGNYKSDNHHHIPFSKL